MRPRLWAVFQGFAVFDLGLTSPLRHAQCGSCRSDSGHEGLYTLCRKDAFTTLLLFVVPVPADTQDTDCAMQKHRPPKRCYEAEESKEGDEGAAKSSATPITNKSPPCRDL